VRRDEKVISALARARAIGRTKASQSDPSTLATQLGKGMPEIDHGDQQLSRRRDRFANTGFLA
jgi:hypothetical protein